MRITHFSSTLFFLFSVVVVDFFLRLNLIFCSNIPVIVGCIPLNLHFFVVKVLCWTLLPPFGPYSWSSRLLWGLDRWWEHRGSRLWPSHQLFWEVGYRIDTVNPFFTVDLFASVYLGFFFSRLCVVRRTETVEGKIWQIVRSCGWIWREYWSTTWAGVLPSVRRTLGSMSRHIFVVACLSL